MFHRALQACRVGGQEPMGKGQRCLGTLHMEFGRNGMELQDYLKILRRRRWVVVRTAVVVVVVAIAASAIETPTYQATAILLVKERGLASTLFGQIMPELSVQPERGLRTQADLVKLRPVATRALRRVKIELAADELVSKMSVVVNPQSNLMTIGVNDRDPRTAQRLVNAMAEEYVAWNRALNGREIARARDEVRAKLESTEENMLAIARRMSGQDRQVREGIRTQWSLATALYSMLAEKYEQLRIISASSSGDSVVVAPSVVPASPVSPRPVRNVFVGLILGLLLGGGLAFLYEYLDNTLKSRQDIEEYVKLPVLGEIPLVTSSLDGKRQIVSVTHPRSVQAEAFRMLRSNLHYLNVDRSLRCFIVTSPSPGEGKSTVAANLAVAFARAGQRVRILCCDLRRPIIHGMFGVDNKVGLTNVLCDRRPVFEAVRIGQGTGVEVLTSGPIPPDPSELLGSRRMAEVIEEAKAEVDVVIIDAPPIVAMSDVLQISPQADGVIMVARAGDTTRDMVKIAKGILDGVQANVLGVVLNAVTPSETYGYYGYYGYRKYSGYYGQYGEEPDGKPLKKPEAVA